MVSEEDRFRRKRQREDSYIQQLASSERPILVIKGKQVFHRPVSEEKNKELGEERFFKRSENTRVVDDLERAIESQEALMRRVTFHQGPGESDEGLIKIKGIEFLPRGFLELDPLLFRDEYTFGTESQLRMFQNEQRRLKALRRRQYEQKRNLKAREVTIFSLGEGQAALLDRLETFYFRHRRRMNDAEIEATARELGTSPEKLADLQDVFLRRAKLENERSLRQHLEAPPSRNPRVSKLPPSLQKFLKTPDTSRNKTPNNELKVNGPSDKDTSLLLDLYEQKVASLADQITFGARPSNTPNAPRTTNTSVGLRNSEAPSDPRSSKSPNGLRTSQAPSESRSSKSPNGLRNSEASKSSIGPRSSKSPVGTRGSQLEKSRVSGEKKASLKQNELAPRASEHRREPERVSRALVSKNSLIKQQFLRPSLVGSEFIFTVVQEVVNKNGDRAIEIVTKNEKGQEIVKKSLPGDLGDDLQVRVEQDEGGKKALSLIDGEGNIAAWLGRWPSGIARSSKESFDDFEDLMDPLGRLVPRLSTKAGISVVKIFPVQAGGTYYCQSVRTDLKGSRLLTHDETGKLIDERPVAGPFVSDVYLTKVAREFISPDGQRVFELQTFNDRDQMIASVNVIPPPSSADPEVKVVEELVDEEGNCKYTLRKQDGERTSLVAQKVLPAESVQKLKKSLPPQTLQRFSKVRASLLMGEFFEDIMRELELQNPPAQKESIALRQSVESRSSVKSHEEQRLSTEYRKAEKELVKEDRERRSSLIDQSRDIAGSISAAKNDPEKFKELTQRLSGFVQNLKENEDKETVAETEITQLSFSQIGKEENELPSSHREEIAQPEENFGTAQRDSKGNHEEYKNYSVSSIKFDTLKPQGRESKPTIEEAVREKNSTIDETKALKKQLENFIESVEAKIDKNSHPVLPHEERIREIIIDVFNKEKHKIAQEIREKAKRSVSPGTLDRTTLEEFQEFCDNRLPYDSEFKDRMLYVSLFYYFLERKGTSIPF